MTMRELNLVCRAKQRSGFTYTLRAFGILVAYFPRQPFTVICLSFIAFLLMKNSNKEFQIVACGSGLLVSKCLRFGPAV